MLTAIVLLLFLLTTVFECLTVLKHEGKKIRVIHIFIMSASFCVLILYSLEIYVPSPNDAIQGIIGAIFKLKV